MLTSWVLLAGLAVAAEPEAGGVPGPVVQPTPEDKKEKPELSEEEAALYRAEPWRRTGLGWGGLPAVNYNADDGVGFGVLGTIYRYNGAVEPYKAKIYFLVYFTTKGVQTHRLQLDLLDTLDLPLRLTTRVEYSSGLTNPYCGLTPPGDCGVEEAEAAAVAAGLAQGTEDYDTFVRRYYLVRDITPNVFLNALYELDEKPTQWSVFGTYYGEYKLAGTFEEPFPYPGSRYALDFPDGEVGFLSLLQAGVAVDNRDNEPAPTRGYWAEASVRGSSRYLGSAWDFFGWNATFRGYVPLGTERVVFADRLVVDGMVGDAPVSELGRAGGTQLYSFFGGQRAGRGVRYRRVVGKAKVMNQVDLRATVWSPTLLDKVTIDVTPVAFLDAGYWSDSLSTLTDADRSAFVYGTGGGLRLAFNKNFVLRGDVGFSPLEDWSARVYLDVDNLW